MTIKIVKKNRLLKILAILLFSYSSLLSNDLSKNDNRKIELLLKIFPESSVKTFSNYFGFEKSIKAISQIKIRGSRGFIPINSIYMLKIDNNINVMSFEIFLINTTKKIQEVVTSTPYNSITEKKGKLLQTIIINDNGDFLAKPSNFPIESEEWHCFGDFCQVETILSLHNLKTIKNAFIFSYSSGLYEKYIRLIYFNGSMAISSKSIPFGDIGGESGFEKIVNYSNFNITNNVIFATKTINVINSDSLCQSKIVKMLSLENANE